MKVDVKVVGWGIFKIGDDLVIWDDYPDDGEHKGYGILISYVDGTYFGEIQGVERDDYENVKAFILGVA